MLTTAEYWVPTLISAPVRSLPLSLYTLPDWGVKEHVTVWVRPSELQEMSADTWQVCADSSKQSQSSI